jgi:hypothetical protein
MTNLEFRNFELNFIGLPGSITVGDHTSSISAASPDSLDLGQALVDVSDGHERDSVVDEEGHSSEGSGFLTTVLTGGRAVAEDLFRHQTAILEGRDTDVKIPPNLPTKAPAAQRPPVASKKAET